MPTDYVLDHARRIVRARASGVVTGDELMRHSREMRDLFANGTLDASWCQLADFSATTGIAEISAEDVRRLAIMNPWPREARRIFVAPATEMFGLTRMYQLLTGVEGTHLTIVRSEKEALSILDHADPGS